VNTAASEIMDEALASIRQMFYQGADKEFYQDLTFLRQAVTFPASWLDQRAVGLSAPRYREVFQAILAGVRRFGRTKKVRRFSVYLLHCVQEHMHHHGEEYYDEGKRLRSTINDVLLGLKKGTSSTDSPVAVLAEVHRALRKSGATRQKPCKASATPDLFACMRPTEAKSRLKPLQTRAIRGRADSNRRPSR
jgi:hypothetical protein